MSGYLNFKQALKALDAKIEAREQARQPVVFAVPTIYPKLASVATIQKAILPPSKKEAIEQVGNAILAIEKLNTVINQLVSLHRLPVKPLFIVDTGRLHHDLATACWYSNLAESRLAGGVAPDAPVVSFGTLSTVRSLAA